MTPVDLGFTRPVPRDGYAWWYMDAYSDDHRHGLTIIAFIGSVFSPWYAWARRKGPADPRDYACFHIVLTGPGGDRWAMTERRAATLCATQDSLTIGPSGLAWDGRTLTARVDEVTFPVPQRVRGTIRLHPSAATGFKPTLDSHGLHRWWPIAPFSRVEVELDRPGVRWSGPGYFDSNWGDGPLEDSFKEWDWCRGPLTDGASILYDVVRRDGSTQGIAIRIGRDGSVTPYDAPARVALPGTRWWRISRETRCEPGHKAEVAQTLLDAPFYARSVVKTRLLGQTVTAMHESLDLDRFRQPWVQALLPFRVPRRG